MVISRNMLREILQRSQPESLGTIAGRYKRIDYRTFTTYSGIDVLFIEGSNEPRDWFINLMGFIAFPFLLFHPGYWIKAIQLNQYIEKFYRSNSKKVKRSGDPGRKFILSGYSYGAAIATIYRVIYGRKNKNIFCTIVFGCPSTIGLFNFATLKWKRDKYISLSKRDDFTNYTGLVWPYRKAWFQYMLKSNRKGLIKGHYKDAYFNALKEDDIELKTS